MQLSPEGGRVLGCIVEKQLTTPQQYPLTKNALTLACNQATNRDPVVAMDDDAVSRALDEVREKRLVRFVLPSHGRSATRYRHVLDEVYDIDEPRLALLATLLLRGPQTSGELRGRVGRMSAIPDMGSAQAQLELLAGEPPELVQLMARRPGQKEDRWRQMLAEEWGDGREPIRGVEAHPFDTDPAGPPSVADGGSDADWEPNPTTHGASRHIGESATDFDALSAEVASLRTAVSDLQVALHDVSVALEEMGLGRDGIP